MVKKKRTRFARSRSDDVVPTHQSKQHISTPKEDEEVIARSDEDAELPPSKTLETRNEDRDIVNLCIQEYIALRSEQRTRLDSANRIIHYYAIVLAALTVGILNLMRDNRSLFDLIFPNILLLIPLVSLPFAFAQQNEELFVRDIGDYFETIKEQIAGQKDSRYWGWENHHNLTVSTSLIWKITGIFRSGLLIIFSALSLAFFYAIAYPSLVSPVFWIHEFSWRSPASLFGIVMGVDWVLIIVAISNAVAMGLRSLKKGRTPDSPS